MLSRIKGKILETGENRVIIDVHGLGFEVLVPQIVLDSIADTSPEEDVSLVIYFYFQIGPSRSTPVLIGFNSELEKEFFESFITVASIGPKSAVKALIYPFSQIAMAIDRGDEKLLKSLPGVGPRKVKEIIAKLQGKLYKFLTEEEEPEKTNKTPVFIPSDIKDEALDVLLQLQFTKNDALKKIEKVLQKTPDVKTSEELINLILRE